MLNTVHNKVLSFEEKEKARFCMKTPLALHAWRLSKTRFIRPGVGNKLSRPTVSHLKLSKNNNSIIINENAAMHFY